MIHDEKKEVLKIKTIEDFYIFDDAICKKLRDDYYNQLLKDNEIKKHIQKIFNVPENAIDNALIINNAPPIDNFKE